MDEKLLGWEAKRQKGAYNCQLSPLSEEEQKFLSLLCAEFSEFSKTSEISSEAQAKEAIEKIFLKLTKKEGIDADEEQKEYLQKAALSHLHGFAPLDAMLSDNEIEEIAAIAINEPIRVYIRKKGWQDTNAYFTTHEHLIHLINKMSRPLGRRITSQSPRINALMPNGSRLHATIPPLSAGELTIRLHGAKKWGVCDLLQSQCISADALAFLWLAFQSDSSVLICGNTSSGKTTLLNCLLSFVPLRERLIIIEETPEITPPHPHRASLVSNDDLKINMCDLVRDSLRMRPDRVIVGEVRTPPEVEAYVETLLSGHARGSYATFHSNSASEAIRRMCNLGAMPDDLASLDFLILQRRISRYCPSSKKQTEARRMIGIFMPKRHERGELFGFDLLPIFEYSEKSDSLQKARGFEDAMQKISQKLAIPSAEARKIFVEREKFLASLTCKDAAEECKKIQKFAYG
ncbi:hypothetical protein COU37_00295 [Candidatus Micrarchaeota archaeon CG10_big_fil_rev_8_21_14_0_10_45_29]|nr:MAG: hypothetical protein COU37_00295 [Candidatus Micrarchaeota archaeon CG10_big_fil_rev_8_21_14_0_10_45_29]